MTGSSRITGKASIHFGIDPYYLIVWLICFAIIFCSLILLNLYNVSMGNRHSIIWAVHHAFFCRKQKVDCLLAASDNICNLNFISWWAYFSVYLPFIILINYNLLVFGFFDLRGIIQIWLACCVMHQEVGVGLNQIMWLFAGSLYHATNSAAWCLLKVGFLFLFATAMA